MTAFCLELERSLSSIGSCARLSSTSVLNRFGPDALQPRNEYRDHILVRAGRIIDLPNMS